MLGSCSAPTAAPVDTPGPIATAHTVAPAAAELSQYGLEVVGVKPPGDEICETNPDGTYVEPVAEGKYEGLLRNAKCEQQKYLTMARVAEALGVDCSHCHVQDPKDPKKRLYPEFTDNKRKANWMFKTFIQGLRPVNGGQMQCSSCHSHDGEPAMRILRNPRDRDFAQEWMHQVMTTQFVEANGKRLKCKTCHVGVAPDVPGWVKDVVRRLRYKGAVERRDELANDVGE